MKKLICLIFVFPLFLHSQYINGPLSTGTVSNSGVTSPPGSEWSEVQNETGNTTYSNTLGGISCSVTSTIFRCADDFVVPFGETWTISQVVTFAYETNYAGGTSPIIAATLQIWDGVPGEPGSTVVFGDPTTNRLHTSGDTGMWRIFNSSVPPPGSAPATNRKIWNVFINVSPPKVLHEGTYWIDWNTQIAGNNAHFAPPTTIVGVRSLPGMNARQFTSTGWQDVIDVGNPDAAAPDVPLDFPFQLLGSFVVNCNEPSDLVVSNLTETSAEISWDASIHETEGYNWVLMDEGDDPILNTPIQDGNVASGITSLMLTGLDDNTTYDFYIQTDCDVTQSDWEGPLTFTTEKFLSNVNPLIDGLKIFPNPVRNTLYISAEEVIEKLVILNILGQRILEKNIYSTTSELDLSLLVSGYYFVEITVNGQSGVYKLMKK